MYIRTQVEQKITPEGILSNALCPCCQTRTNHLLCDVSIQQQLRSGLGISPHNHSKCTVCQSCHE